MSTLLLKTFHSLTELDRQTIVWVSRKRKPQLDRLMKSFTRAGDWQSWTLLILGGWISGGTGRQLALALFPPLMVTLGVCYAIKRLLRRPRPNQRLGDFSALLHNPDPYSFPSSHTACAFSACVAAVGVLGPAWTPLLAYAALIGYSRVHVGAHYPLDVLIGAMIGSSIALLAGL